MSFVGILLATGIHKLPSIRDYWSQHAFLGVPGISRGMPRNRFLDILSSLHLNDNQHMPSRESPQFDKLFKVRPLLDKIKANSQAHYYPHQPVAVDEAMILFKVRSTFKQYMPMKPTKRGYKAWCLCDSVNGYMYNIDIYTGKVSQSTANDNPEDGLATRVVKSMVEPLYGKGHHVYMDNFFSSVALADYLKSKDTYTIGTARVSYKGWPLELKDMKALNKSLERGAHRSKILDNDVQCLVWKDKKAMAFISTISAPSAETQVSRRNKDGSRSEISCPNTVKLYNAHMGGVDLFDSRRKTYSCSRKSKKWWLRLFYFLLDTAVTNSYVIYKETPGTKPLTLKDYTIAIADEMMSIFSSRKRKSNAREAPIAARLCERHFPDMMAELKQCRVCPTRKRTKFCCSDCSSSCPVPLCPTKCFRIYHTVPFLPRERQQ